MTEPLLLLHGAPGDGRLWRPVIEHVISDVEVITPTLSYFDDSIWPDDGRGFGSERHADDIVTAAAAAAAAKGRPVRLVVWSYSVLPGLLAALRRPELFTSILAYEPGLPTWVEDQNELARFGATPRQHLAQLQMLCRKAKMKTPLHCCLTHQVGSAAFPGSPLIVKRYTCRARQ